MISNSEYWTLNLISKTSPARDTLKGPNFYNAQSLVMRGLVTLQGVGGLKFYAITEKGRKELNTYDLCRSDKGAPPTKPAA